MSDSKPVADNDVFQEDVPTIVDGDVLEAAKENIQPIAKGRRVTALSAILSTPHAQRESRLASARQRLRINVEVALEDEDDDPLDAYCRFVDWTVENYPQGHSAESGLLELLEEATRVLRNDREGKWKDDIRFCLVNEIGTSHALLYEEFAIALERAGRKAEADETYLLGIARRAVPVERLETKYREFQRRMLTATALPVLAPPEPVLATSSTFSSGSKAKRTVLGETSSSKSRSAVLRSAVTPPSQPEPEEDIPPRSNARMQVFVDPSGEADQEASPAPWPELGTRKTRIKENLPEVRKIAGSKLKQPGKASRTASAAGGSRIPVFRDPDGTAALEAEKCEMPPPPASGLQSQHSKTGTMSSSSKIPVFRDEEPTNAPSKNKIFLFRDEGEITPSAAKAKPAKSTSSKIAVFRDEEEAAPSSSKVKPKANKIPVFRDEEYAPPAASTRSKTSKIAVFRDVDSAPALTSSKSKAVSNGKPAIYQDEPDTSAETKVKTGTGKIAVFRDEEPVPESSTSKKGKTTAPAKLTIFRDEDGAPGTGVPVTPKFIPFKDEEVPLTPSTSHPVQGSVMKEKVGPSGPSGVKMSSEGEALRKDPLKNYTDEEKVGVEG